jgi:2',3'-cyclic-nucleotide 2'-phosphodiesterase / 3'-nucleotidase
MKFRSLNSLVFLLCSLFLFSCSVSRHKNIAIIESTDIHGVILPYDFIEKENLRYSMASSYSYVSKERKEKDDVVLLDNGDNLQGQPEVYYYNFIDTVAPHFLSEVMNFMGYDAGSIGNHDIEAGHKVYDRMVKEDKFPLLAANAVDTRTGKPYFKPYQIIKRNGIKIAVLGMVTPSIPSWLPPELYSGIEFKDMVETAKLWMPVIKNEKPDLIVGLFHSGWDKSDARNPRYQALNENGSTAVAYNVPGFDIIFTGHDHRSANEKFINSEGDTVLILNGGSRSELLAQADVTFAGKKVKVTGKLINVKDYKPDNEFIARFKPQSEVINEYVDRVIGNCTEDMSTRDSYFGSSAFVDMIQKIQLEITHADISFAAPLSFDVKISKGPVTVGDMFKLYRFENMLYTITMTGEEVKEYLEYSYAQWLNTMKSPDDLLLNLRTGKDGKPVLNNKRAYFKNPSYSFDSAAGIDYFVDITKNEGERITITGFTDGRPFDPDKKYLVALNSYRGNGGGGHLSEGAGIPKNEIAGRLIRSTDHDLRYYILKYIEEQKTISPKPLNNWKIVPESWVRSAKAAEFNLLFGDK